MRDALVPIRDESSDLVARQRLNLVISAIEVEMSKKKPAQQVTDEDRRIATKLRADAQAARVDYEGYRNMAEDKLKQAEDLETAADKMDGGKLQ